MAGLHDFNAEKHNYFLTQTDDPGDVFDDAAWAQVVENFRTVALAAKEAGYKGLIFDNEEYGGKWQNYPEHYEKNADSSSKLAYQNQAALRGKQIIEAINEVFPDAEFGVMHGSYMSVYQAGQPSAITSQGGAASDHELRGPFFTGLAEGLGPNQKLIDMGELYKLRTQEDFKHSQDYRSNTIQDLFDWSVSDDLRANWDDKVTQSHMLITTEFPPGSVMAPGILEPTLVNAFKQSEDVVFIFSNPGEEDWFTQSALEPAWYRAIENAQATADQIYADGYTLAGGMPPAPRPEPEPKPEPEPEPDVAPQPGPKEPEVELDVVGNDDDANPPTGGDDPEPIVGIEVRGDNKANNLTATSGDDVIFGLGGNDTLIGGAGDDLFYAGRGKDEVRGGAGADTVNGNTGNDTLIGGGQSDRLFGNKGHDDVSGNWGGDRLFGGRGNDTINGDSENDLLSGGRGGDAASGGDGDDRLAGGPGNDRLNGDSGDDEIDGGNGKDYLSGGAGFDHLTGGAGRDIYVFDQGNEGARIYDFEQNMDRIQINTGTFEDLVITQRENVTVVEFDGGYIEILNTNAATVDAADFLF